MMYLDMTDADLRHNSQEDSTFNKDESFLEVIE